MYEKPVPEVSIDTAPYWDGLRERRLLLQRCGYCGAVRHYPRPMCDRCHSMRADWVEASRRGWLHSWTVVHHPFVPGFREELPYVLAMIDLEEGVRMQCALEDGPGAELAVGLPVEILFREMAEALTLPFARLSGGSR